MLKIAHLTPRLCFAAALALAVENVNADEKIQQVCNCHRGGGGGVVSAPLMSNAGAYADMSMGSPGPLPYSSMMSSIGPYGPSVGGGGLPPGTLGQTYLRPSHAIPAKKPPREGMLDVHVAGADNVVVVEVNEFRLENNIEGFRDLEDSNVWHFESKSLMPGQPHIYRVIAVFGQSAQERYVRLIKGRIVDLQF